MRGVFHELDVRRLDHDLRGAARAYLDHARIHLHAVAVAVRYLNCASIIVENDLVTGLGFENFLTGLRRFGNRAARVPGAGPDRITQIAAFELDPDACVDVGHGVETLLAFAAIDKS